MDNELKISFLTAIVFAGLLSGASLDQSFKQLPARHRIGLTAYSTYAKAADLKNGVLWYAIIGIGTAISTIITAIIVWKSDQIENFSVPIYAAAIFSLCHSICTSQAAPTYFRLKIVDDEKSLGKIFKKFEVIQTVRSIFVVLNFIALVLAIFILL
jgi:hypothetical protein